MTTRHGFGWGLVAANVLSVAVAAAQPAVDVPTLVKGLQQRREHFKNIAGRVVIGRKALRADKPEPQPSLTLMDFARDGEALRVEQREVIVPTLRWTLAYGALNAPAAGREAAAVEPWQLYYSLVCDGTTMWSYDRSTNRCSVATLRDRTRPMRGPVETIEGAVTLPFGDMVGEHFERSLLDGSCTVTIQGVDRMEGHDCYRLYADTGWKAGEDGGRWRTHYRLWIAPDLDYGAVRSEAVQCSEKLGLISCIVQRTRGWERDEQMALWVPASYQNDWFTWTGMKEMELPGPGWHQTTAVGRLALTNRPDAVAAALPLRCPFDCEMTRRTEAGGFDRTEDPARYANELTPLLGYQPPDEFGAKLTPTTDFKTLFAGR